MFEMSMVLSVCLIFGVAGIIKGIVGNGLPVIAIGLLTLILGLQEAIAIAVIPTFITNFWQACIGGYLSRLVGRLWPYLLASVLTVAFGTMLLIAIDAAILTIVLGLLISLYAILGVVGKEFKISAVREKTTGVLFGAATGLIGGMTGSPAYPGMYFLNGLGFNRNQLVQALGLSFFRRVAERGNIDEKQGFTGFRPVHPLFDGNNSGDGRNDNRNAHPPQNVGKFV